jgi:transposase
MLEQLGLALPVPSASATVIINGRCTLRREGEHRVVVVSGLPVHHYSGNDAVAEAYALVFLVDAGYATQPEVARAFGRSERTVRRHQARYADGGMAALATRSGWRPGRRRLPTQRRRLIEGLRAQGLSNRAIAQRLGLTENAIRKQVGPSPVEPSGQPALPWSPPAPAPAPASELGTPRGAAAPREGSSARPDRPPGAPPASAPRRDEDPGPLSLDVDPANRTWDRLLACFGYVDDAAPVFGDAPAVPGAGVLFAVPALVASGIFQIASRLYGEIGPAFYGLRTILEVLLFMALWRIKRPEALKEQDPAQLGRVLGLDRAPEVRTVRRKLTRLASYHQAERLGAELARRRVEHRGHLMGFLYVDASGSTR